MRGAAGAAIGLLLTLALVACGTKASSSATSSASPTGTGAATTGAATTGTGTGTGTGTAADPGTGTATAGDTGTTGTASVTSTTTGRRRGHGGNGLPAAPPGLTQATGYGSYERCQGTCTGSVPAALRRPLNLPAADGGPCPITLNPHGPVSPGELPAGVGFHDVSGSQWLQARVTWTVVGGYTGPLLIRGEMLGGGAVGFGTGAVPYDEVQLLDPGQGAPRVTGGGRAWITDTRIRTGGCYAYQVDGTNFSEVVVFRAVA